MKKISSDELCNLVTLLRLTSSFEGQITRKITTRPRCGDTHRRITHHSLARFLQERTGIYLCHRVEGDRIGFGSVGF